MFSKKRLETIALGYFVLFMVAGVMSQYVDWKGVHYIAFPAFVLTIVICGGGFLVSMWQLAAKARNKFYDIYFLKGRSAALKAVVLAIISIPAIFVIGYLISVVASATSLYHWR